MQNNNNGVDLQRIQQQLQQMQQQQQLMNNMQQQHPPGNFQNMVSPMDASTGSSARLMAMAGMAGIGNQTAMGGMTSQSNSVLQNMQALLQNQQPQSLSRQHSLTPQQAVNMVGLNPTANTTNLAAQTLQQQQQMLFQQQMAALQKQQFRDSGTIASNAAMAAAAAAVQNMRPGVVSQQGIVSQQALKARQQQLLQQMQEGNMDGSHHHRTSWSSSMFMDSSNNNLLGQQQLGQPLSHFGQGAVNSALQGSMQQQLAHAQLGQHQLGQVSLGQASQFGPVSLSPAPQLGHQLGQQPGQQIQFNMGQQQQQFMLPNGGLNQFQQQQVSQNTDGSMTYNQRSSPTPQQVGYDNTNNSMEPMDVYPSQSQGESLRRSGSVGSTQSKSSSPTLSADAWTEQQMSFLDGRFAGGWQSNADLPDRRRVICSILEVIRQMRPDTSKLSTKLPHMAKSLEEHLYRSAKSKEDYMNPSTLKRRLQAIAHGLEIHRTADGLQADLSLALFSSAPSMNQQAGGDDSSGSVVEGEQNSNWNVSAAAMSNPNNTQSSLSGLASQFGSTGNFNPQVQLSATQQMQTAMGDLASSQHGVASMFQQTSGFFGNAQQGMLQQTNAFNPVVSMGGNVPGVQHNNGAYSMMLQQSSNNMGLQQGNSVVQNAHLVSATSNSSMTQGTRDYFGGASDAVSPSASSPAPVSSKLQEPSDAQKKRVILQQQQRLILLRHASKCKAGSQCTTKFCSQMITLWKHMKTCRDKNCKTPHCLSSRCVLNHYRICKNDGRTSTCEVCGPVMQKIKQQERGQDTSEDPLTRDQNPVTQAAAGMVTSAEVQQQGSPSQLQLTQLNQKSNVKAQLDNLRLIQSQQEQLKEQQSNIDQQVQFITDHNSQQAKELREQQILLQQLQKKLQQRQLLIQQELVMQASSANDGSVQVQQGATTLTAQPTSPAQPDDKLAPVPTQQHAPARRGSGKGKRFGQKIGRQSEESKKRASAVKSERIAKKSKASVKPLVPQQKASSQAGGVPQKAVENNASVVKWMTKEAIQRHLDSLNKRIVLASRTVTHKCRPLIQELIDDQFGWVFRDAVDPVALGLPDYFDVVKTPMHLDLVRKKLDNAIYSDLETFAADTRLVFENAILYNGESSEVGELAQTMMNKFNKAYTAMVREIESSHLNLESQGELCSLCGMQKRKFEPTVLYCQGTCSQRIKRNSSYFTDRTKQNHWCDTCFADLDPSEPILLDDGTTASKNELQEYKNDGIAEEGWVNCDDCQSWVHQICALFNGRTNKSNARFTCPKCYHQRKSGGEDSGMEKDRDVKGASELPQSKMSEAIEKGLHEALQSAYLARAQELKVDVSEVEKAEGVYVRVVSHVEKKQFVGDKMYSRYVAKGCAKEFPVRTKCIALFQKIHGVDILLFALYVYEYGQECPAPNKRRVYISYLDSVQYFEPKCYRTIAYHAILVEYLRYVKKRGFHTAHIWSCPPTPGDDYIFYCHPEHQLVPREDMLREWYQSMLEKAKAQGIVIRRTTLYDEYFAKVTDHSVSVQKGDPTCLPYFEGDYIPGEIENIISQEGVKKHQFQSLPGKDDVMSRLGHNLFKMKENFMVAHLRSRRFAAAVERGEDVSSWREDSDDEVVRSKRAKISMKGGALPASPVNETNSLFSMESVSEVPTAGDKNRIGVKQITELAELVGEPAPDAKEQPNGAEAAYELVPDPKSDAKDSFVIKTEESPGSASTSALSTDASEPVSVSEPKDRTKEGDGSHDVSNRAESDAGSTMTNDKGKDSDDLPGKSGAPADTDTVNDVSASAANKKATKPESGVQPSTVAETEKDVKPNSEADPSTDTMMTDATAPPTDTDVTTGSKTQPNTDTKMTDVEFPGTDKAEKAKPEVGPEKSRDLDSPHTLTSAEALVTAERNKRALEETEAVVTKHMGQIPQAAPIVDDTSDQDSPFENDMFESRQQFLNYCTTNHCQFDELRRAKHSSIMVLFHLHNPSAPKFLQQCGACYRDITHGIRYHCNMCSNFDLCEECYEPVTSGLWAKRDARFAHDKNHTFKSINMEAFKNSQMSPEERQRALKAHVELIEHAGSCPGSPSCSLHNCQRMKGLFVHVGSCDVKPKKDCRVCTRLLALGTIHSRMCRTSGPCPIPFCDRIRSRNERLRKQQQLMDDRRRQAQNELYHA